MKIGIIANTGKEDALRVAEEIIKKTALVETVFVEEKLEKSVRGAGVLHGETLFREPDMLLVLGGDGTLLGAARHAAPFGTPVLGINLGHVGFLTGVEKDVFLQGDVYKMLRSVRIENRMMLEAKVHRGGKETASFYGLNDAVIRGEATEPLLRMCVKADGMRLSDYVTDGLVFATPTGSTAYSFSAGGALVHPEMEALLITPICPYMMHARPVILPGGSILEASFASKDSGNAYLNVDGEDKLKLENGDTITICRAPMPAKVATLQEKSFLEILKEKLKG